MSLWYEALPLKGSEHLKSTFLVLGTIENARQPVGSDKVYTCTVPDRTATILQDLMQISFAAGVTNHHDGSVAYGSVHWEAMQMTHTFHIHNDGPTAGRRNYRHAALRLWGQFSNYLRMTYNKNGWILES